jgi:hypothetical protein
MARKSSRHLEDNAEFPVDSHTALKDAAQHETGSSSDGYRRPCDAASTNDKGESIAMTDSPSALIVYVGSMTSGYCAMSP